MTTGSKPLEKLNDPVFGEMEYRHSWHRDQSIVWWGRGKRDVTITAHAYNGKGITDQQRAAYAEYQKNIEQIIRQSVSIISDMLRSAFDVNYGNDEIFNKLVPRSVLFQENGDWGILFDAEVDVEHGIALYKRNGNWQAGLQDDFL